MRYWQTLLSDQRPESVRPRSRRCSARKACAGLVLWHVNSVMYSCRLGQPSCLLRRQALQGVGEIGAGELPLERPRPDLVVGLEGEDLSSKVIEGGRVRRREDFALEDREVNFHLIQPAGMEGQVHRHQVLVSILQAS